MIASRAERRGRRDRPRAIVDAAKQACEYSWGIEARPAKPSERTVSIGERRAGSIANHGVIANGLFRQACQGADAATHGYHISFDQPPSNADRRRRCKNASDATVLHARESTVGDWIAESLGDERARTIPSAAKRTLGDFSRWADIEHLLHLACI